MRMKSMVAIGFMSMVVAAGVASASDGAAFDVQRVNVTERIGAGGAVYSSSQPDGAGTCSVAGVSATERIGHGGSTYSFSRSKSVQEGDCHAVGGEGKRVETIERIGAGGSIYLSGRFTIQVAHR